MNITPRQGRRNYAKGGYVRKYEEGGLVEETNRRIAQQQEEQQAQEKAKPPPRPNRRSAPSGDDGGDDGGGGRGVPPGMIMATTGKLKRTGAGTAFVDTEKYPGWPQMQPFS